MFLLFDTSIIVQDFKLSSTNFRIVKDNSYKYGIKMFVSDVVIDEAEKKYKEKISEFNNINRDYFRLLPKEYLRRIGNDDIENMVKEYREFLTSYFLSYNDFGTRNVPVAYDNFLSVYNKAINKVKPFNSSGKGFKDALIWEAIKWIVLTYCDGERKVAFITSNIIDFSDKERINDSEWYIPSKHLRDEYTNEGYPDDTVRIYDSLNKFNLDVIHKKTNAFNAIKDRFENTILQTVFSRLKQEVFSHYINYDDDFQYRVTQIDNAEVVDAHSMYGNATDDLILSIKLDAYCEPIGHHLKSFWAKGELYISIDINTYEIKDIIELNIKVEK